MRTSRRDTISILSGCVWAGIAYWLGRRWMPPYIWGGVIASPFIGLLVGRISTQTCKRPGLSRGLWSLWTLY
ncbi:MAG: hypothetical protein AAF961_04070, partial [Planctomycetota bacterium]